MDQEKEDYLKQAAINADACCIRCDGEVYYVTEYIFLIATNPSYGFRPVNIVDVPSFNDRSKET